jgi:hypothetical protein
MTPTDKAKAGKASTDRVKKPDAPHVVIIAPEHDQWTSEMCKWPNDLNIDGGHSVRMFTGAGIDGAEVREFLRGFDGPAIMIIFYGHGTNDALLGVRGPLVEVDDLPWKCELDLYAFCCKAARLMGRAFEGRCDKGFLGYDPLPLCFENAECVATWRDLVNTTAEGIIQRGGILADCEPDLQSRYNNAFHYYYDGGGKKNPMSITMMLYLDKHTKSLWSSCKEDTA